MHLPSHDKSPSKTFCTKILNPRIYTRNTSLHCTAFCKLDLFKKRFRIVFPITYCNKGYIPKKSIQYLIVILKNPSEPSWNIISKWKSWIFSFREKEQEKLEQLEFELEEERGTRKEVEAQLSDFVRYVKKLSKIFSLHLELERSRNTSD